MNWREVQERWQPMQSVLMTYWPVLTREDMHHINGDRKKLAQTLQKRCGYDSEQAENAVCEFEADVRYPGAVK